MKYRIVKSKMGYFLIQVKCGSKWLSLFYRDNILDAFSTLNCTKKLHEELGNVALYKPEKIYTEKYMLSKKFFELLNKEPSNDK